MKLLAESRGGGHRLMLLAGAVTFALLAVLAVAARARATETIYWDNYRTPASLAFADITGGGGGELNLNGAELDDPEGQVFDPVTGRVYSAQEASDEIIWSNVDGSGSGVLNTAGAKVESPHGVVIDAATRTIYWANEETEGSIGWAHLDGSGGGTLNTTGANTEDPYRPGIDSVNRRIYWFDDGATPGFSFADLGGAGGGDLPLSGGAPEPEESHGIYVDAAAGRLYWIDSELEGIFWVNLSGVGGGEVDTTGSNLNGPYGLAFDPSVGRFYWGNYSNTEERAEAIGTATLAPGGNGGITPVTAPVNGPQDPLVLKSPTGTVAPQLTQNVAALSCSQGGWSPDYPDSFVYGAPTSYSYQWLLNGQPIAGATGPTLTATSAGSYSCAVTGRNVTGSATQTGSTNATVTPATLSVGLKSKKVQTKAGKTATVSFAVANAGDLGSAPIQVCAAKLTKKAKKGLVAPKCASVPALASGGTAVATLKVKTKKTAKGTYKFTTQVKGASVRPVTVSVKVNGAKKHKKKHHKK